MTASRFNVIFQKLAEAGQDEPHAVIESLKNRQSEYDEIDELRRLALEVSQPELKTYTATSSCRSCHRVCSASQTGDL